MLPLNWDIVKSMRELLKSMLKSKDSTVKLQLMNVDLRTSDNVLRTWTAPWRKSNKPSITSNIIVMTPPSVSLMTSISNHASNSTEQTGSNTWTDVMALNQLNFKSASQLSQLKSKPLTFSHQSSNKTTVSASLIKLKPEAHNGKTLDHTDSITISHALPALKDFQLKRVKSELSATSTLTLIVTMDNKSDSD